MSDNLSYEQIIVDRIKIPKDRKYDERVVKQLVESIKKIGLLEPIVLCRPARSMGVHLVAGRNRVEAFKRLKIKAIPSRVEEGDTPEVQQWRELAEIDENLIRREFSAAQRAKITVLRREIYETMNPDTPKTSGPRKKGSGETPLTFARDTAAKTGRDRGEVYKDLRRGALGAKALDRVTGTSLDREQELDALAKLDKTEREEVITRAARGEDVTARAPEPTPGYAKLIAAWNAASPAGREKFKDEVGLS